MEEPQLDDRMLRRLMECRDSLLRELAEQHAPPEPYATSLWQAYKQIAEVIEEMKRLAGVEEPLGNSGWTIYRNEPE